MLVVCSPSRSSVPGTPNTHSRIEPLRPKASNAPLYLADASVSDDAVLMQDCETGGGSSLALAAHLHARSSRSQNQSIRKIESIDSLTLNALSIHTSTRHSRVAHPLASINGRQRSTPFPFLASSLAASKQQARRNPPVTPLDTIQAWGTGCTSGRWRRCVDAWGGAAARACVSTQKVLDAPPPCSLARSPSICMPAPLTHTHECPAASSHTRHAHTARILLIAGGAATAAGGGQGGGRGQCSPPAPSPPSHPSHAVVT